MRRRFATLTRALAASAALFACAGAASAQPTTSAQPTAAAQPLTLSSPEFQNGQPLSQRHVFSGFGCSGDNHSPALQWSGSVPEGTRSFALTVHDPDAPTGGSGWWHWVVVNLPADARELPAGVGQEGKLPAGAVQVKTDFGTAGWGGPCPPQGHGPHRYVFTLYALKVPSLTVDPAASTANAGFMINANALGKATLTGTYGR